MTNTNPQHELNENEAINDDEIEADTIEPSPTKTPPNERPDEAARERDLMPGSSVGDESMRQQEE